MRRPALLALSLSLVLTTAARADQLELSDGTVLKGTYAGGERGLVHFELSDGLVRAVPVSDSERERLLDESGFPAVAYVFTGFARRERVSSAK